MEGWIECQGTSIVYISTSHRIFCLLAEGARTDAAVNKPEVSAAIVQPVAHM